MGGGGVRIRITMGANSLAILCLASGRKADHSVGTAAGTFLDGTI